MTGNPQDRERLAKMLNYNDAAYDLALKLADRLLAAGVTLPPAPKPPLLTEDQVEGLWNGTTDRTFFGRWDCWSPRSRVMLLAFARAAAEEAIRGRVRAETTQRNSWDRGAVVLEGVNALGEDESEWFIPPAVLLALFGLE